MGARNARLGRGPLLIIGGAEDPDEDDMIILPRLVELAGGKKAKILVCAAATTHPESTNREYRSVFEKIGVAEVMAFSFDTRDDGEDEAVLEAVERATAVFFTGGDQLRLTSVVAGTTFSRRVRERHREGLLVSGTSAGAAVIPGTMISRGSGSTVCRACVDLAPGLDFWPETIIDTHFDRSGRVHRVMATLAQNPGLLAFGIDEDTALEVPSDGQVTVLGRGVVTVFDGRVRHTNVANLEPSEPIAMTHAALHVLPHGYGFDLAATEPVVPETEEVTER